MRGRGVKLVNQLAALTKEDIIQLAEDLNKSEERTIVKERVDKNTENEHVRKKVNHKVTCSSLQLTQHER